MIRKRFEQLDIIDIKNEYNRLPDKEKTIIRLAKEYECSDLLIRKVIDDNIDPSSVSKKGIVITVMQDTNEMNPEVNRPDTDISEPVPEVASAPEEKKEPAADIPKDERRIPVEKRIGESRMMRCGERATITEYHNSKNIDVMFEDGTERKGLEYGQFVAGRISKEPRGSRMKSKNDNKNISADKSRTKPVARLSDVPKTAEPAGKDDFTDALEKYEHDIEAAGENAKDDKERLLIAPEIELCRELCEDALAKADKEMCELEQKIHELACEFERVRDRKKMILELIEKLK